jgi:hypothetical protein
MCWKNHLKPFFAADPRMPFSDMGVYRRCFYGLLFGSAIVFWGCDSPTARSPNSVTPNQGKKLYKMTIHQNGQVIVVNNPEEFIQYAGGPQHIVTVILIQCAKNEKPDRPGDLDIIRGYLAKIFSPISALVYEEGWHGEDFHFLIGPMKEMKIFEDHPDFIEQVSFDSGKREIVWKCHAEKRKRPSKTDSLSAPN